MFFKNSSGLWPQSEEIARVITPWTYYSHLRIVELVNQTRDQVGKRLYTPTKWGSLYAWLSFLEGYRWSLQFTLGKNIDTSKTRETSMNDIITPTDFLKNGPTSIIYTISRGRYINDILSEEWKKNMEVGLYSKCTGEGFLEHFGIKDGFGIDDNRCFISSNIDWRRTKKWSQQETQQEENFWINSPGIIQPI